jgi:hypothetical protein
LKINFFYSAGAAVGAAASANVGGLVAAGGAALSAGVSAASSAASSVFGGWPPTAVRPKRKVNITLVFYDNNLLLTYNCLFIVLCINYVDKKNLFFRDESFHSAINRINCF